MWTTKIATIIGAGWRHKSLSSFLICFITTLALLSIYFSMPIRHIHTVLWSFSIPHDNPVHNNFLALSACWVSQFSFGSRSNSKHAFSGPCVSWKLVEMIPVPCLRSARYANQTLCANLQGSQAYADYLANDTPTVMGVVCWETLPKRICGICGLVAVKV